MNVSVKHPVQPDSSYNILKVNINDSIKQNIERLLQTPENSVFYLNDSGSRIKDFIGKPIDPVTQRLISLEVKRVINENEQRVDLDYVTTNINVDFINLIVVYTIKKTGLTEILETNIKNG